MESYIFGAKATAAGLYKALSVLEPERKIKAFLVSDMKGNPSDIWGCPVRLLNDVSNEMTESKKSHSIVYVAVSETIQGEIRGLLENCGFMHLEMLCSRMEADVMERYFEKNGKFPSVHSLPLFDETPDLPKLTIYAASFYKDKPLDSPPRFPAYIKKLYLGCERAKKIGIDVSEQADFYDDIGDNISAKNPNRCEMTAHYWVWKNRLKTDDEYVGIFHYRRTLDLSDEDLRKIKQNDVDIVLPFPMVHYPNCGVHHTWYMPERDWELMVKVVKELAPEYAISFEGVFGGPYFYNYNMMLAKKKVFADYCTWLYPILDRIEELSEPKGIDREDRYTAYMSESLTTLYFMTRACDLKVYHTGRLIFT